MHRPISPVFTGLRSGKDLVIFLMFFLVFLNDTGSSACAPACEDDGEVTVVNGAVIIHVDDS